MSRSYLIATALVIAALSSTNVAQAASGYGAPAGYGASATQTAGYGSSTPTRWRTVERNYNAYDNGEANVVRVIRRIRVRHVTPVHRVVREPAAPCE